jgi:hypothetical protein
VKKSQHDAPCADRQDIVARSDSAQLEESSESRNDDNQVSVGIAMDAAGNRNHLHGERREPAVRLAAFINLMDAKYQWTRIVRSCLTFRAA